MTIAINLIALFLMVGIIGWFWLYKPKAAKLLTSGHVKITVENGVYSPDVIHAPQGQPLTLEFLLKDASHCAATVSFPDFNISKELTLNESEIIDLKPEKTGHFEFTCPMGMYKGTLVVDKPETVASNSIDIIVDGGVYSPDTINIPTHSPVTLNFIRKDESHCASTVVFEDFGISEELPVNQPKKIVITAKKPGTYKFACAMGMYQGKIIAD